ncbi:hypothetical protein PAPYR_11334 [Paratrimastix pyriformis]|uniref:Uncharacterized protein n=1 Tax=Paratrimastix pyriformis TaxID=342808 RepID=A0ABQ8U3Z3_9EUKA|nr:hypothetical protein PAPYR_11334 [Paratrimastix pyriformis]
MALARTKPDKAWSTLLQAPCYTDSPGPQAAGSPRNSISTPRKNSIGTGAPPRPVTSPPAEAGLPAVPGYSPTISSPLASGTP